MTTIETRPARWLTAALAIALAAPAAWAGDEKEGKAKGKDKTKTAATVHGFKVKTIDGKKFDLRTLKGRVLMLVNVASR